MATEPTYPTYVVNQDWTTFTAHQPGATYGDNPNSYTYAETGFGSIFRTIVDGNRDFPTRVPGAVGVYTENPDDPENPTLQSPIDLTAGYTIAVVKGDFVEEAAYATEDASYTLDFSSLYEAESLRTKFVGTFVSEATNDVGFRVSKGTVEFGATAVLDEDEEVTNRTTITLNRKLSSRWAESDFVVGGALVADDLTWTKAIVTNTDLTVNGWVWVGSQNEVNETANDAVCNFLEVNDSVVTGTTLQVRNVGQLNATDSTFDFADMILRGNVSLDASDVSLTAFSNIYGENNKTATLLLKNGSTLISTADFQIGKPDSGTTDVKRAGAVVLEDSSIGFLDEDDEIVRSGNINVKQNGSITMDADSKIYATDVTNEGAITIATSVDGEDWIDATTFTNTVGTLTIDASALTDAQWEGVKRVVYATNEDNTGVDLTKVVVDDGYDTATSKGKIAIAKGVDFRVLYVNHDNDEDVQFAKTVTIDFDYESREQAEDVDYYVAFNAFSDAGTAIGARKYETTPADKKPTQIILLDGTTEALAARTYAGANEDFDGLTFLRYGEGDDTYDVSVTMTSEPINDNPDAPVYQNRVLVQGFTVGEGVTFAADRVQQMSGRTDIDGELYILKSDVEVVPGDPSKGYVPSFRVGGGDLYVNEGAKLTSEFFYEDEQLIGGGNLDVNATNRTQAGAPIPATMTVDNAFIDLYQLTIGSNATVTLKNMKNVVIDDNQETPDVDESETVTLANVQVLQMKNPEALDFAKPRLELRNTDLTVWNKFDGRAGTVDMDMDSTLRVVDPEQPNVPPVIGGGTFHLTINEGEIDPEIKFYKLVYAKLDSDVVLSCNADVSDNQEGRVIINGETTSYIYTSLAKDDIGQGLFVMDESIRANLFVKTDWDYSNYEFGDFIEDGKYYQVNAFGTLVEALDTAATYELGKTTITVYSGEYDPEPEEGETPIHLDPTQTLSVENIMAGDVVIQGEATVVGEGDEAEVVYAPIQIVVPFASGMFFLTAEEGKTITIAENASLDLVKVLGSTDGMGAYTWLGFEDGGDDFYRTGGEFQIDGSVTSTGQLTLGCKTTITATGSVVAAEALQIMPVLFEDDETDLEKITKGAANPVAVIGDPESDEPQVQAETISVLRGLFQTTDASIECKSLALSGESVIASSNTLWTITSNIAAYAAGNADGDWYPAPTGIYLFTNGSVVNVTGEDGNTNNRADFPTYADNAPVAGNAQFDAPDMKVLFVNSELNVAGTLINGGTAAFVSAAVANIDKGIENTGDILVGEDTEVNVYGSSNAYGVFNQGTFTVNGGSVNVAQDIWFGFYNEDGTVTLDDATFDTYLRGAVSGILNRGTININGDVFFTNETETEDNPVVGLIQNYTTDGQDNKYDGRVVFGVSNIDDSNDATILDPATVDANIEGGTVAFSKAGLTFDMAVTGATATAEEVVVPGSTVTEYEIEEGIVSAKLLGGTIYVDQEDITLTDSGLDVPETVLPVYGTTDSVIYEAHTVWNDTNHIKIADGGSLTLDTSVEGWTNIILDNDSTLSYNDNSLVVGDFMVWSGGHFTMDWSQCLTVTGDLIMDDEIIENQEQVITVTLSPLDVYSFLNDDKLVIAYEDFEDLEDYYFVENYKKYFTVHVAGEWIDPEDETLGTWETTGLYLDASKFIKVSATHDEDPANGWYQTIGDASAADTDAAVILILDGDFSTVDSYAFLNNIETIVFGGNGYSEDPEENINPPILPSGMLVGGIDVWSADLEDTPFGALKFKYADEDTSLTIMTGLSNGNIIAGDLFENNEYDEPATSTYFYRNANTNLTITGGTFTAANGDGREIVGAGYYYGSGDNFDECGGTVTMVGDVNLTITGGAFTGYDVFGGHSALWKKTGKYSSIDGNVTITLGGIADDDSDSIVFAKNEPGEGEGSTAHGGNIYAGSKGAGAITGDVEVILTGDKDLVFEKLFGGSTGDFRNTQKVLQSSVDGERILTFSGFTGDITGKIEAFEKVQFFGANEVNFTADATFNMDVTDWVFDAESTVTGSFAFDFTGDFVDLSDFNADNIGAGFTLNNVTADDDTFFAYDEDALKLTVANNTLTLTIAEA